MLAARRQRSAQWSMIRTRPSRSPTGSRSRREMRRCKVRPSACLRPCSNCRPAIQVSSSHRPSVVPSGPGMSSAPRESSFPREVHLSVPHRGLPCGSFGPAAVMALRRRRRSLGMPAHHRGRSVDRLRPGVDVGGEFVEGRRPAGGAGRVGGDAGVGHDHSSAPAHVFEFDADLDNVLDYVAREFKVPPSTHCWIEPTSRSGHNLPRAPMPGICRRCSLIGAMRT
jgi:hypothetical protein